MVELDPAGALRVEEAVRSHASRLAAMEPQHRRVLAGAVVTILLTIAGSITIWPLAAWLALRWNLPSPAWQLGFVMFWLLPSALLGVLPLFGGRLTHEGETV